MKVFNEKCQESWRFARGRGMKESVRLLWVLEGRKCVKVHEATTEFSNSKHISEMSSIGVKLIKRKK